MPARAGQRPLDWFGVNDLLKGRKPTLYGPWRILKMHEFSVICQCHDYLGSITGQKYPKLLIVSKK